MEAKYIYESIRKYLKPKSQEDIINDLKHLSQEQLDNTLLNAIPTANISMIKYLLEAGADVNIADKDNWSTLFWASRYNNKDIIELLLAYGADIETQTDNGWTALMMASYYNYKDIVEILLVNGANTKVKNNNHETPLSLAEGCEDVIELLKNTGQKNESKIYT